VDAIKGIETVKAVGGEPMFRQMMLGQFQGVAHKLFRADFTVMSYEGAAEAITFLGLGLFLWAGAKQVLAGQLTIGGLVAFNSLVTLATVPIHNLLTLWDTLQRATVMLNRLDDVFDQEPEQGHDRSRLRPVRNLTGHVSFRNVGFRYGGPEAPAILQDITLEVPAGKTIAIVGRSGSGQDHAGQVPRRLAGADRRHDPVRRTGSQDAQLPRPAPADRVRAPGFVRIRRHHRPQHRLWRRRARHDARDVGGAGRECPGVHRPAAVRV
jgi:ABC-type transport system involved in Fe-S cluster assembly fused permease/ATPase subunit